jgi:HPt (histidine-containing phosphotransfer) domain-containing protein/two-component sensor histidine kinase
MAVGRGVLETCTRTSTEREGEVQREIDETLANRSVAGVYTYAAASVILVAATGAYRLHPIAASALVIWVLFLGAFRLATARAFERFYPTHARLWRGAFCVGAIAVTATFGLASAAWLLARGLGADTLIVIVTISGISAGAMVNTSARLRLARAGILLLQIPQIVVLAGVAPWYALVMSLFPAFLLVETRNQHTALLLSFEQNRIIRADAAALAERTAQMRRIFDTVDQGFLTVASDGTMAPERSRLLDSWRGVGGDTEKLWEYVGRVDPNVGAMIALGWESLAEAFMPREVIVAQLPKRIQTGARTLQVEYREILKASCPAGTLVILSDVTNEIARERLQQEQRDFTMLVQRVLRDREGFFEFIEEVGELVRGLTSDQIDLTFAESRRLLHTVKGNAAMFGLQALSVTCHDLESRMCDTQDRMRENERQTLAAAWRDATGPMMTLLGRAESKIEMSPEEYDSIARGIARLAPRSDLAIFVERLRWEPTKVRLSRLSEQAQALAQRLGKGKIRVVMEANGLRLPHTKWAKFWSSFVHMIRNAVDHGLETSEERLLARKPAMGTLTIRTFMDQGEVVVSLADDGRGIDWSAVAASARSRGLPYATRVDLEEALFSDGLTTVNEVTEWSGRGVGLGAVRTSAQELGGRIAVASEPLLGTRFEFRFPGESRLDKLAPLTISPC